LVHAIVMPSVGMFTAEGSLSAWLKSPGERVEAGEPVVQITTEKTTQELVAPASGIVHPVAELGATLPIQALIGYILADGEQPPPRLTAPPDAQAAGAPGPSVDLSASRRPASPVARRLAAQHGVDLSRLTGSGPGGRIVEADVQAAVDSARDAPTSHDLVTPPVMTPRRVLRTLPFTGVRRTIADRVKASQAAGAQVTLTRDVEATTLVRTRAILGERLGRSVPFDALFARLFALALREHPDLNATIEAESIVVLEDIHIGFAVASAVGLVVPVVRHADTRSFADVTADVRSLSERAQKNQLQSADMVDGTATITNLGAYSIDAFSPIINPPQSVILGIGRIMPRPFVYEGRLTVRETCMLSLTFDHRVVDGAPAAQLLDGFVRRMADEHLLLGLV
jgi:pyruvate dehydrogenase E2 component (dihydrolipoamide acetyltransferase)